MDNNFNQIEPPAELINKVFSRIKYEQKMARIKKIAFFSAGILSSVLIFVPMFIATAIEIRESGFTYIFSLIFSDFQAVVSVWDNFLLSVLETLPIMRIAVLFLSVYVFLGSVKYFAKNILLPKINFEIIK